MRTVIEDCSVVIAGYIAKMESQKGHTVFVDHFGWYCDLLITDEHPTQKGKVKIRHIDSGLA